MSIVRLVTIFAVLALPIEAYRTERQACEEGKRRHRDGDDSGDRQHQSVHHPAERAGR